MMPKLAYPLAVLALIGLSFAGGALSQRRAQLVPHPLVTATAAPGMAGQAVGPHGGKIITDSYQSFEVVVNPVARSVDVYANRLTVPPPPSLSVTLYSNPETGQTIDARPVNLEAPEPHYQGRLPPIPEYQGRPVPANDSYVDFGVAFSVSLGPLS